MSPRQIQQSHPKRAGESPEGYAVRLLEFAEMHYTCIAFGTAISTAEQEQIGKAGDAEDALTNVIITLSKHKAKAANRYEKRLP